MANGVDFDCDKFGTGHSGGLGAAVAAASRAAADAAALGLAWPFQAAGGEVWLAPTSLAEALRGGGRAGGGRGADGGDAVAAPGAPTTTTAAAAMTRTLTMS